MVSPRDGRSSARKDHRNGYSLRDFVTRFGTLRLRIARSRKRGFLPEVIGKFQRRAEEVCLLIREAFLRGISTRQVGRVVGLLTGEVVSAQTVSQLVSRWRELAGASAERPAAGANAGGLRGAARQQRQDTVLLAG
jgi:putative transposase